MSKTDTERRQEAMQQAIGARGERSKTNSAEFLWIYHGIKPPLLPDKPVVTDPKVVPDHLQLHPRPAESMSSYRTARAFGQPMPTLQNDPRTKTR